MAVEDFSQMQRSQAQGRERAAGPTWAQWLTMNHTDGQSRALQKESGLGAGGLGCCEGESPPVGTQCPLSPQPGCCCLRYRLLSG